jgi:hypothetical protein
MIHVRGSFWEYVAQDYVLTWKQKCGQSEYILPLTSMAKYVNMLKLFLPFTTKCRSAISATSILRECAQTRCVAKNVARADLVLEFVQADTSLWPQWPNSLPAPPDESHCASGSWATVSSQYHPLLCIWRTKIHRVYHISCSALCAGNI